MSSPSRTALPSRESGATPAPVVGAIDRRFCNTQRGAERASGRRRVAHSGLSESPWAAVGDELDADDRVAEVVRAARAPL